jgi:hypothetical protein
LLILSLQKTRDKGKIFLPGSEAVEGEREGAGGQWRGRGEEMTQRLYAHTNKIKILKKYNYVVITSQCTAYKKMT